ncbi:MAG TPA: hypothetical protein VFN37_07550, partial [Candidatus Baltobacteraceae bacterium]|nr:hypothetical protein [Candidatus Baltobacteraceae bacterium]
MNTRFRLPIVALCVAFVLAGCGSVTQGIKFAAPAGWTGTPAMFGRFQMWMKNGQQKGSTQLLMLVKGDAKNTHGDLANLPPQYSKNLKVLKKGTVSMCGGTQPGEQLVAQGTDADRNGTRSEI